MNKSLVPQSKMGLQRAVSIAPYLTPEEVYQMAEAFLMGGMGKVRGRREESMESGIECWATGKSDIVKLYPTGTREGVLHGFASSIIPVPSVIKSAL